MHVVDDKKKIWILIEDKRLFSIHKIKSMKLVWIAIISTNITVKSYNLLNYHLS